MQYLAFNNFLFILLKIITLLRNNRIPHEFLLCQIETQNQYETFSSYSQSHAHPLTKLDFFSPFSILISC